MARSNMQITAIAPWFGGKRTLADTIVEELGPHSAYFDIFCGGLPIVMAKPEAGHETVLDLHGDLTNLAMVIASRRWHELHERLHRTLYSEALFKDAKRRFIEREYETVRIPESPDRVTDENIDRAYWYFVVAWMGRNGTAGSRRVNHQIAVRWTPGGGGGGARFSAAVDSMPPWHERLRNVIILNRDAFIVLPKIDDVPGVAIYADPPYLMETRGSGRKTGRGGGSNYEHDFTPEQHEQLAAELGRFKRARVVISYYEHPLLKDLYPESGGWTHRRIECHKNLHVQNRRGEGKKDVVEVLILNGESRVETPSLFHARAVKKSSKRSRSRKAVGV